MRRRSNSGRPILTTQSIFSTSLTYTSTKNTSLAAARTVGCHSAVALEPVMQDTGDRQKCATFQPTPSKQCSTPSLRTTSLSRYGLAIIRGTMSGCRRRIPKSKIRFTSCMRCRPGCPTSKSTPQLETMSAGQLTSATRPTLESFTGS
jgi:hypothetical protein